MNDLNDVYQELKTNKIWQIVVFLLIMWIGYKLMKYINSRNNFLGNGLIYFGYNIAYSPEQEIHTLGQEQIKREIIMPPVDPLNPNCGMVFPLNRPSDEKRKETRMELMNMIQYNSTDDDFVSIDHRPKGLFVIP